jgi:hypothetical protein
MCKTKLTCLLLFSAFLTIVLSCQKEDRKLNRSPAVNEIYAQNKERASQDTVKKEEHSKFVSPDVEEQIKKIKDIDFNKDTAYQNYKKNHSRMDITPIIVEKSNKYQGYKFSRVSLYPLNEQEIRISDTEIIIKIKTRDASNIVKRLKISLKYKAEIDAMIELLRIIRNAKYSIFMTDGSMLKGEGPSNSFSCINCLEDTTALPDTSYKKDIRAIYKVDSLFGLVLYKAFK